VLRFFSRLVSLAPFSAGLVPPRPFAVYRGALVILATAILGLLLTAGTTPSTQAAADIGIIAIDTDITGNVATPCDANGDPNLDYPCNNSTVLGPIDSCRSIAVGQSIQIDVVGIAIPAGGTNGSDQDFQGAGQSDMALDWTPNGPTGPIQVTAKDRSVALIHQGLNDYPAGAFDSVLGASSTSGHWKWTDVDVNSDLVGEGGQGIAIRLTIKGINAGVVNLSIGANILESGTATWTDIHGHSYSVGAYGAAQIFVGSACPPTPTPAPSPSPSPQPVGGTVGLAVSNSGSPIPWAPLAAVSAGALALLGAGFWYGRRRWSR
jgi:hypothetical protein